MKIPTTLLAASLALLVNVSTVSYAQDEKQDEAKPRQEEPKAPESKREKPAHDEQAKPEEKNQDRQAQEEMKRQGNESRREQKQEKKEEKNEARSAASGNERHHQAGQRIPEEKFRATFGPQHHFHVSQPVIVEGRPRFQYSGYWFEFVDAWPVGWSYSDDCYIDYIDGEYFLFDVFHPSVRLAVIVVL